MRSRKLFWAFQTTSPHHSSEVCFKSKNCYNPEILLKVKILHVHFQVTSWLHTQTQVLLPNSGTSDSGEENPSAATSVSSLTSQAQLPKHQCTTPHGSDQKCQLKCLSKHTWFWFVFNFTGSEKLHPSHACISTMLNPSE